MPCIGPEGRGTSLHDWLDLRATIVKSIGVTISIANWTRNNYFNVCGQLSGSISEQNQTRNLPARGFVNTIVSFSRKMKKRSLPFAAI